MGIVQMQQIRIGTNPHGFEADETAFLKQQEKLQATLLALCPAHLWHDGSYSAGCSRPILIGRHHQQQLENLHEALTIAITDIVQRWWTDSDARFPEQMPLEKEEGDLLKWLDVQVSQGNLKPFSQCLGSWRPDFLVEDCRCCDGPLVEENFSITEINARFSFNGFMHEAYGQQALEGPLEDMSSGKKGLVNATSPEIILGGLFSLFQPDRPLHLLKGQENGIDIHMFIDAVQRRFGVKPRLITPAQLRLVPDVRSKTGYRLCCISKDVASDPLSKLSTSQGDILEEVYQVGLELHQSELFTLDPEMLRQVSLRCFNDMRTILLVHDKRMLGVVRQDLANMLARKVLRPAQAKVLEKGIVETIIPGSPEMGSLLQSSNDSLQLKDEYLLKPIRSGKGDGIVFGEDLTTDEWVATLERLQTPKVVPGISCVVQRRIVPRLYDMMLKPSATADQYPLVGTYHVVNGQLLGLGTWRASKERVVAVSCGGSWICSVISQD